MKNKRRIFGITAVLLAVVLISAVILQETRDTFAYTNTSAKTSRTFENGWATVSVNGPAGQSWVSLKFTYSGSQMSQADFNDKARSITIEKNNVSSRNPYELQLVPTSGSTKYSTKTAKNDAGRYTLIYFEMQYKIPAHETARASKPEVADAPYTFESQGRFKSITTHSTSEHTVKVKVRVSIYSIGICTYTGGKGEYDYNRFYGSWLNFYTEKKKYTVNYKGNGGTIASADASKSFACGSSLTFPKASRSGYTLTGWRNSASHTGTAYTTSSTVCSKALTLYAQWKANQYKIYYNSNGGNGTMNDSTVTYDGSFTLPKNTFTKNGYKFLGWSRTKGSEQADYDDEEKIKYDTASNLTLYAVWGNGQYKISFSPNGADGETIITTVKTGEASTLTKNSYTRDGYTFLGWNSDPNGSEAEYKDEAEVTDLADVGKTKKLYAVWRKNDGSFNGTNIIHDEDMFTGDIEIEGGNGTGYDNGHTDSEYARIDKDHTPGYFTKR